MRISPAAFGKRLVRHLQNSFYVVWSESCVLGEITSNGIILKPSLLWDFFRPSHNWFGRTFRSGPSTAEFGKFRNNSGMTSTHRAENIFPKYLLYNVHEIARKYPRGKNRYSSFSDSVGPGLPDRKKIRCGDTRRLGRLPGRLDAFAAIWSPQSLRFVK